MSSSDSSSDSSSEEEQTIADDIVVSKYKLAAEIANRALKTVAEEATAGALVIKLCERGDEFILKEIMNVLKKSKDMKKGIAFPTSVSVNNYACHFSPLRSDKEVVLKDGDLVKIELGVHVDGFISSTAHSLVVGVTNEAPLTGRRADVLIAAHLCAQAALRLIRPGNNTAQVTETWNNIAKSFKCSPVEGILSHQLKQHVIDGEKSIVQNPTDQQRREHKEVEFKEHEVYAVDVLISSGEGKAKDSAQKATIYKRVPDKVYGLRLKTSRIFFTEVERRFGVMPFPLRAFQDERKAKVGAGECVQHGLLKPYNVLQEREGEFVAQFKFTVLLMPNGLQRITNSLFKPELYKSEYEVEDKELEALIQSSAGQKKKASKSKAAG